jgi:hypothetical protein
MSDSRILKHPTLPISAAAELWSAMGWTTYANTDTVGGRSWDGGGINGINSYLARGIVATGANDERVIAWAVAEQSRHDEAKSAASAVRAEAEAITKLADALKSESERATISRIMSRLTERTQYALRQQLAGSGLIN